MNKTNQTNPVLLRLRDQFQIAIHELEDYIPLVTCTFRNFGPENRNFEYLPAAISELMEKHKLIFMSGASIQSVVADARLFLNDDEKQRFFSYCMDEFTKRKELLDTILLNDKRELSKIEDETLQNIFFEYMTPTHGAFPIYKIGGYKSFSEELCNFVLEVFNGFKLDIERLLERNQVEDIEPKSIPQFQTNLNDSQRTLLFDLLVSNNFIPADTDKDFFKWAFGGKNDKFTSTKIKWLRKKQLLRELLIPLKQQEISQAEFKLVVPLIFIDRTGNYITLANNKFDPSFDSDLIAEIHKKLATC